MTPGEVTTEAGECEVESESELQSRGRQQTSDAWSHLESSGVSRRGEVWSFLFSPWLEFELKN